MVKKRPAGSSSNLWDVPPHYICFKTFYYAFGSNTLSVEPFPAPSDSAQILPP
jgi:hypothetical protein